MKLSTHEEAMSRCIHLAEKGAGMVAPNPLVGAVLVKKGEIISEGWHQVYGGPHAEVNALAFVPESMDLSDATLYVNLEPCSHHGKTPPCADLIIRRGIGKVVIGMRDPFELVAGNGIRKLREAGIEVVEDVLRSACLELNKRFVTFHTRKRPYIMLKWAQSADGFMDKKRRPEETGIHWITGSESRRLVHQWRAEESAILVGSGTVLTDNPQLTVRDVEGKNPQRIVLDYRSRLSGHEAVFAPNAQTYWINAGETKEVREGLERVALPPHDLPALMEFLHGKKILSVLIEGGAEVLHAFIREGLWDEARVFTGKLLYEEGLEAPVMDKSPDFTTSIGEDRLSYYRNR